MNPFPVPRNLPALRGSGRVGEEVAAVWPGARPAALAFQWRRDGAPIPGAVAPVYVPGPEDDGAALDCLLLPGGGAGPARVVTAALRVTCPPPRVIGLLPEEVLDAGSGPQRIEAAGVFAGLNLVFSAAGGGAAIDPRTGVLIIPTDRPRAGETVTVVAANSGGAVRAALRFTVEAEARPAGTSEDAPPAPEAVVLPGVWRGAPCGPGPRFAPVVGFPGLAGAPVAGIAWSAAATPGEGDWCPVVPCADAPGTYELRLRGPDGAIGAPALFDPAALPEARTLRFRWRSAEAEAWSPASAELAAPPPEGFPPPPPPTERMLAVALGGPLADYDIAHQAAPSTESGGLSDNGIHLPVLVALAAFHGMSAPTGGIAPLRALLRQLRHWAANAMPAGRGGYPTQFDMGFVATTAIAWRIDAARAALTPLERTRLTLGMKASLIGSAWDAGAGNPYGARGQRNRNIRGYRVSRNAPNFSTPPLLVPHVVAGFLGPEAARAFMEGFDREAFAAEILAAFPGADAGRPRVDMYETYRRDWTDWARGARPIGPGPSRAELEACIREGWVDHRYGQDILSPAPVCAGEIERFFSKRIKPGLVGRSDDPAERFGIFNPARGLWAGRIADRAAWGGLPDFDPADPDDAGVVGMAFELDALDEGGPRSAMSYANGGLRPLLAALLAIGAQGRLDIRSRRFDEAFLRLGRGVPDLDYRMTHGYQDYAKGGATRSNNNLVSYATTRNPEGVRTLYAIHGEILAPWRGA